MTLKLFHFGVSSGRLRYWILGSLAIDGACSIVAMANTYGSLVNNSGSYEVSTWTMPILVLLTKYTSSVICAATDMMIAGSLAWTCLRIESPYATTRNVLRRVMIQALACGFTTAISTTLMTIFLPTVWNDGNSGSSEPAVLESISFKNTLNTETGNTQSSGRILRRVESLRIIPVLRSDYPVTVFAPSVLRSRPYCTTHVGYNNTRFSQRDGSLFLLWCIYVFSLSISNGNLDALLPDFMPQGQKLCSTFLDIEVAIGATDAFKPAANLTIQIH
ncbi:uncharacterized protein EV420DRAFT_1480244 [Desarmillaria tabescens]|uniref:Uncharacterized protein n=1 Tax=Armillaria tabescens TaxID=1929756 RepID=A0AA39N5K3_ARMTA|nr:uncharacterized protein EV420DRAFT_1480244 [Desarmillaria tabescens]KAK0458090.1 hypothetical protein EV420DRAFT_1480244 [Desarmillaria tabescens]